MGSAQSTLPTKDQVLASQSTVMSPQAMADATALFSQADALNIQSLQREKHYAYAVGDSIKVWANENPTTGFTWHIDTSMTNKCGGEGAIVIKENRYVRDVSANGEYLVGAGGKRFVEFEVTNKASSGHDCSIGFENARSWEMEENWAATPQKKMNIHIK